MHIIHQTLIGLIILTGLSACSNTNSKSGKQCSEPRPEICTREFKPVCATLKQSDKLQTYSNGCTACADNKVVSFTSGECQ